MVLTGGLCREKWEALALPYLGLLCSPKGWRDPWIPLYALDNDCFANSHKPDWWESRGESAWIGMLNKIPADRPPLWCLLPDVVSDWSATLARAERYLPELRRRSLRSAVALQDGCDYGEALALGTDWVFIGGSTEWKLASIEPVSAFFRPRGVRVHVGRVNGRNRLQACLRCGVDSVDGTGWAKWSRAELPKLDRTMENWRTQIRFALE